MYAVNGKCHRYSAESFVVFMVLSYPNPSQLGRTFIEIDVQIVSLCAKFSEILVEIGCHKISGTGCSLVYV